MTNSTDSSDADLSAPSVLLQRPGAVALPAVADSPSQRATDPDAAVAWHYGDPLREQRDLASGAAVTDLSHRGMVLITGPDRLTWLHSLTSQALSGLQPGVSTEALILSPHGHVEHSLHVVDDGERTWLSVEPGAAPAVVAFLQGMRFRKRVVVEDVSSHWAAVGMVIAPGSPDPVFAQHRPDPAPPSWQDPWPEIGPDSGGYTASEPADHPGWARPWRELYLPRAELAQRLDEQQLAGSWAAHALRIAAWRPREGFETDNRLLPHEADWIRTGVHLEKGCYRGQETVARVYHLGRPPRRLVMLHLDGSEHELPALDAPILPRAAAAAGGVVEAQAGAESQPRSLGRVSSVALHYELGPIALAVIKRNADVSAELDVTGIPAVQEVIVDPALTRGQG